MMLKIVSTNIRFDNPNDGKHDWTGRKNILSSAINHFSPCIVGSQEGRKDQLKDFEYLLENLTMIDSHRDWISERMYPCLYYDNKVFDLEASGDVWLSETPSIAGSKSFGSAFPRLCTWAILSFKNKDTKFLCVNVHLDHVKTQTRQEQIKVLIKEISSLNIQNLPIILMGDFNEGPNDQVRNIIGNSQFRLKDPWSELNKQEEVSHHGFEGHKISAKRIDWILVSPEFNIKSIELYKESVNDIYPSDHFPVFAEFTI